MKVVLLALVLSACVVGEETTSPVPPDPVEPSGVISSPRHGEVITGETSATTLEVTGYHSLPGTRIDVQVLADPSDPASWTTIGTTVSEATASTENLYRWQLIVAPARTDSRRWPDGGVLRLRAIGETGEILAVLFHDVDDCGAPTDSLHALIEKCTAPVTNGLVLVSPSPTPADVAVRSPFLDRRNAVDVAETLEYYTAINAPATLADFKTQFGFDATNEPTTFYNAGDLGIGREMHCQPQTGGGLACYVSNYGTFGGDRAVALDAAVKGVEAGGTTGSFATVAMVYTPPITAPNSVKFVVYSGSGARLDQAQLDQFGDNVSVPNNCLNCHGGATYDAAQNAVMGARFLPFDATSFDFSELPRYQMTDQLPKIRALNQMIARTEPTAATKELVDGFSGQLAFVPPGWSATNTERAVYTNVVAVACRSCHSSLDSSLDFRTSASFQNFKTLIADSLCGPSGVATSHDMPSAEVPMRRLWTTSARAYLVDYLNITGACEP